MLRSIERTLHPLQRSPIATTEFWLQQFKTADGIYYVYSSGWKYSRLTFYRNYDLALFEYERLSAFYRLHYLPYRVILSDYPVSRTARNLFREMISLGVI